MAPGSRCTRILSETRPILPIAPNLHILIVLFGSILKTTIHSAGYSWVLFHNFRSIQEHRWSSLRAPESTSLYIQPIWEHLGASGKMSVAVQSCWVVQLWLPNHSTFCWCFHAPQPGLELYTSNQGPSDWNVTCKLHSALHTPPSSFMVPLCWENTLQFRWVILCLSWVLFCLNWVLLYLHWHSHISFCTPDPPPFWCTFPTLYAPQSPSWLRSINLVIFFLIPHSSNIVGALFFSTKHFPFWRSCFSGGWSLLSSEYIIMPFKPHGRFAASYHLIRLLFDITNRAKRHWNSISATCQVLIITK